MIEIEDITKSYGNEKSKSQILKGISLKIKEGDLC